MNSVYCHLSHCSNYAATRRQYRSEVAGYSAVTPKVSIAGPRKNTDLRHVWNIILECISQEPRLENCLASKFYLIVPDIYPKIIHKKTEIKME